MTFSVHSGRSTGIGRLVMITIALVVILAIALAVRLRYVHDKTWEYRLFPTSTPPKVVYRERDYTRDDYIHTAKVEPDFVLSDKTMGGGLIYAPRDDTPTVIDVTHGKKVVEYSLMGGP